MPVEFSDFDFEVRAVLERLVTSGEIDFDTLQQLREYPANDALEVLALFEESLANSDVSNKIAELKSVMKTYNRFGSSKTLPAEVQRRLATMYDTGKLGEQVLDAKVLQALSNMEIGLALRCVENFGQKDLSDVRNLSALFMSSVKAVREQVAFQAHSGAQWSAPQHHAYRGLGMHTPMVSSQAFPGESCALPPLPLPHLAVR
jgi:hypothetical protein